MIKPMPDDIQDLIDNPTRYGVPTFEEFIKNKRKWMGSKDDVLASVDRGDHILKNTYRHKYFVEGYRVDSLEQAERIALDMGFNLYDDFILDPQLKHDESGRLINEVSFRAKKTLEKRSSW